MPGARLPVATYRLQLNRSFGFAEARERVRYLHDLGISDVYASPILRARSGSPHGYDVTDPTRINPELGGEQEFRRLVAELKRYEMGLLVDIVPNHLAASTENPWWADVLENGPHSPYAPFFDIRWRRVTNRPDLRGRVLLPILGDHYGRVLESGQLQIGLDDAGLFVRYFDARLPLAVGSYRLVLQHCSETPQVNSGLEHLGELSQVAEEMSRLPTAERSKKPPPQAARFQVVKRRFLHLLEQEPSVRRLVVENIGRINGGDAAGVATRERILSEQFYRLAYWRLGVEGINYRRFFDITHLVGARVEDPPVFLATHQSLFELAREGLISGLRIDHIDGLRDPSAYLRRLRANLPGGSSSRRRFYVVVEKILAADEELPSDWPVHGTTGYDFLNAVNGVFVDADGLRGLGDLYAHVTGSRESLADAAYARQRQVIDELFRAEVRVLARELHRLAVTDRRACDLSEAELERALVETTACLPVYRTYLRGPRLSSADRARIDRAVASARARSAPANEAFDFFKRVLLLDVPDQDGSRQRRCLRFAHRWQQFTGAVTAKGVEDTTFYRFYPLLSLNDVGGDAERLDGFVGVEQFHRRMRERQRRWPATLNATSTHDTKRSEDVRARIDVLSEMPDLWARHLRRWRRWNRAHKRPLGGRLAPDDNEEMLIYQTLLGAWPLRQRDVADFRRRFRDYVIKAAREAKLHTSWLRPDEAHEKALLGFVKAILRPSSGRRFLNDFGGFQKRIAFYGAFNSLSQALLKIAAPGVPDFYQGTELWDFSLVDPDNRRPVDFQSRQVLVRELMAAVAQDLPKLLGHLLANWADGRVKLYVTRTALHYRREHVRLFREGDYVPLEARGPRRDCVCAFARRKGRQWCLVVVPRLVSRLVRVGQAPIGPTVWGGTILGLPPEAPAPWRNALTGERLQIVRRRGGQRVLALGDVLRRFPVALLGGGGDFSEKAAHRPISPWQTLRPASKDCVFNSASPVGSQLD